MGELVNRIIVIGASAGGVESLCSLAKNLPADLAAATFIVLHVGRHSILPTILRRCDGEHVVAAEDCASIRSGCIYVATPEQHLLVEKDRIRLSNGPRENRHRPSIDVLFRSAARAYGEQVIGVVLSGALDDGAAGMLEIKSKGGIAIVQDPQEALVPAMPVNVMRAVTVDYCLSSAQIAPTLVELSRTPAISIGAANAPRDIIPGESDRRISDDPHPPFVCPDCDGPLTQCDTGAIVGFRCKVGHRFSLESLGEAHADSLERRLWVAIRSLDDCAAIHEWCARTYEAGGDAERASAMRNVARQALKDAQLLCEIVGRS